MTNLLNEMLNTEQISAQLEVSHEIFYNHFYVDRSLGGDLYVNLRCQRKFRKRYACGRYRRNQIIDRRPISERPANMEKRSRIVRWEEDPLKDRGYKQAIVSLIDYTSGYVVLRKVSKKTSGLVRSAIIKGLKLNSEYVKRITFEKGIEFSRCEVLDKELKSKSCFADLFSSRYRAANENLNGLALQYIPKNSLLSKVIYDELAMIQDRLKNQRKKGSPFKILNELFHASNKSAVIRG